MSTQFKWDETVSRRGLLLLAATLFMSVTLPAHAKDGDSGDDSGGSDGGGNSGSGSNSGSGGNDDDNENDSNDDDNDDRGGSGSGNGGSNSGSGKDRKKNRNKKNDQDSARDAVKAGKAVPLSKLAAHVAKRQKGKIVNVSLQRGLLRYVYKVKVLTSDKRLVVLKYDALTLKQL